MKIGFTSASFIQINSKEKIADIAFRAGADIIEWCGDIRVRNISDATTVFILA